MLSYLTTVMSVPPNILYAVRWLERLEIVPRDAEADFLLICRCHPWYSRKEIFLNWFFAYVPEEHLGKAKPFFHIGTGFDHV